MLRELLGFPRIRRALGAGRADDVGDIHNVPNSVLQVAAWDNWAAAINTKLPDVERQRRNAKKMFGALFIRRSRNKIPWIVVMTPRMFCKLLIHANKGLALAREENAAKMNARDTSRPIRRTKKAAT